MKYRISKSNCLKSWNPFSKSPKVFFEKIILNSVCFLGSVCGGVSFLLIVTQTAGGIPGFALHRRFFSFLASSVIFWVAAFESTFVRLLLEQYFSFRHLVIRISDKVFCKFFSYSMIIHSSKPFSRNPLYDCAWLLYLFLIVML